MVAEVGKRKKNNKLMPEKLVLRLVKRSICSVQVAACMLHDDNTMTIGWNSVGSGMGEHAEAAAIRRAGGSKRLAKSTLYIAAVRRKSGNVLTAKPCADCAKLIRKIKKVVYRDGDGKWIEFKNDRT